MKRLIKEKDYEIYAVDFDGTLCENKYPEIGEPKQNIIDFVLRKKEEGHKIILWTCRGDELLGNAFNWCYEKGIIFDAVNANLIEEIFRYDSDPRKIGADYYIDDRNISLKDIV